ncbi:CCA tRNA nucleotidyltransferase [Methyloceanibacter sp. wino2]|uniref:CCA tRNA nucleotidyltransferase n=1 Tax=Methyloceanibacter sp. wino2 TaxID=2170729 RepID=UPI000D3E6DE1|nr:CCA tRNA nucleotidyltransferase [Methyloceanibacter sp. wino2]
MAEHDTPQDVPQDLPPPSLDGAAWLARPETVRVFAALSGETGATRAVGGAVRNALLGLPVADVDFATTIHPEAVIARARKAGLKAIPTGLPHGTVTVVADGVSFEVTTLRRDVETFGRHATVAFTEDWAEDAARRDFTINALYAGADGTLFDPLGGYPDLVAGRVRFIGDAVLRIKEDYLRILRFFRFNASFGWGAFDAEGLSACVRERAGLRQLSAERVASELKRLLVAPRAYEAVYVLFAFGLLCDILGAVPRLSRFARLIEIEAALDREPNAILRLAALAIFIPEDAKRLARRFKLSNAERALLALAGVPFDEALPSEAAAKRKLYRLGPENYASRMLLAWATSDAPATDPDWRRAATLAERWEPPVFPLRGPDITALGPFSGPAIGEMLRAAEQCWIDGGFKEDRDGLLAIAGKLAAARDA